MAGRIIILLRASFVSFERSGRILQNSHIKTSNFSSFVLGIVFFDKLCESTTHKVKLVSEVFSYFDRKIDW